MGNYFFGFVAFSALLLGAATAWPHWVATSAGQEQASTVTIAGCLQAGEGEGKFVLMADDKQAYQVQAAEELAVASHVNHRVELDGTVEKTDATQVLKASALKMIATSCDQSPRQGA